MDSSNSKVRSSIKKRFKSLLKFQYIFLKKFLGKTPRVVFQSQNKWLNQFFSHNWEDINNFDFLKRYE